MKNIFISGFILGLLCIVSMGAVYSPGGGGAAGDTVLSADQTFTGQNTFEELVTISTGIHITAEQNTTQAPIVLIENTGTGTESTLGLVGNGTGDPGILFFNGTTPEGFINYDVGTQAIGFYNFDSGGVRTMNIDSSGNLIIENSSSGADMLLLYQRGAIQFTNFTTNLPASAGVSVLKSTDGISGTSELIVENEANEINQLSGDATFQSVLSSSGPVTLAPITAAVLRAQFPLTVGELYYNSDVDEMFISTGTTEGAWAASDDYTQGP